MASKPKHEGVEVHGVRITITDAAAVRPVAAGVHLLAAFLRQAPEDEKFLREGWLGKLSGTDQLVKMLREERPAEEIAASWDEEVEQFKQLRQAYLLY